MAINNHRYKTKPAQQETLKILNFSFPDIRGIRTTICSVEWFLFEKSFEILALCETYLNSSIPSVDVSILRELCLLWKDFNDHMNGLFRSANIYSCLCLRKPPDHSYICLRISLFNSISSHFFLYRCPSSPDRWVLDSISDNRDKVISLHPFANKFVFGNLTSLPSKPLNSQLPNLSRKRLTSPCVPPIILTDIFLLLSLTLVEPRWSENLIMR